MPPKKRSLPGVHDSNMQSNKRSSDTPWPDSGKRQKHADVNNKELRRDSYCWVCHQLGHDIECKKDKCQRVYHTNCLGKEFKFIDGLCSECQQHKSKNKFLTVDILRDILEVAVKEFRKKFKSPDKLMFFQWPNIESSELVRIIDLDFLEDNIKDTQNPYKSLAGFISDVKWIHHNYCILDGVNSSTAKEAEGLVRTFQKEIFDIEDCPMCYYNMFVQNEGRKGNFFLKICDPPHDIVWAKLKGSPHWPAKCLRVVNGKAHVRFFFTHDKSNIPLDKKKCLAISLHHPEHKSSKITDNILIPKKMEYKEAVEELLDYILLYERKFGKKFKYHLVGTPYKYEAPTPIRKLKKMVRPSVSIAQNSEKNIHTPPQPSRQDSNDTMDETISMEDNTANHSTDQDKESPSVQNVQTEGNLSVEERMPTSEGNTDKTDFVTMNSSLFERANMIDASTSPVLSASMICEVASCSDARTSCTHPSSTQAEISQLNLPSDSSIPTTSFQPLITCTSTPVVTASTSLSKISSQWNMSLSRTPNMLSDTAPSFQELNSYSEPEHLMDTEGHTTESRESVPLDTGPSTSGTIPKEDDEVVFISSNRCARNSAFNPSVVLPYVFSGNPDLQSLFYDAKHVFDSLFIRCWSCANRCPQAPEIISNLLIGINKLRSEKGDLLREKEELLSEKRALEQNNRLGERRINLDYYASLEEDNFQLRTKFMQLETELRSINQRLKLTTDNSQIVIGRLHKEYQQSVKDVEKEKDAKINLLYDIISKLKEEYSELKTKHAETVERYSLTLEDVLKSQNEKISLKTVQEIKGAIDQQLSEIKLLLKPETSSSTIENQERNHPSVSSDERMGSVKKSARRSSTKTTERVYHTQPIEDETTAATINQHFYQQQEIQIARKTSVSLQLERTLKTTTTTRNEGRVFGYSGQPPPPFNLTHIPHHDAHPSNLSNPLTRERLINETKKRLSRFTE